MATLVEILRVANRVILKRYGLGPATKGLSLPHEPSENVLPRRAAPLAGAVVVMDSRVVELVIGDYWEARWRHDASRYVRGSLHSDCGILFHYGVI